MEFLEAIVLGIIQGLSEFLPISSSGHLEIAKAIFGNKATAAESLVTTVVVHVGTALSTLVVFRKDLAEIFRGLFRFTNNEELKFTLKIILSMVPCALVGLFYRTEVEMMFANQIFLVGCALLVTAGLLFLADRAKKTEKNVGFGHALMIGISQAIAIVPGLSRSGATISTSVLLGIDREKSARFSFLMVVPLIFGVMILDTKDYVDMRSFNNSEPKERAAEITSALVADGIITDNLEDGVRRAILSREGDWGEYQRRANNGQPVDYDKMQSSLDKKTSVALKGLLGFDDNQIKRILEHELVVARPVVTTNFLYLFIAFITSFVVGVFACKWMITLVKKARLTYFSIYCVAVGLTAIVWSIL